MIATRIFKFDEEMPEKIELKDSNPYFTKNRMCTDFFRTRCIEINKRRH